MALVAQAAAASGDATDIGRREEASHVKNGPKHLGGSAFIDIHLLAMGNPEKSVKSDILTLYERDNTT